VQNELVPFESESDAVKTLRQADNDCGVLTVERLCDEALEQFPDSAILWAYRADAHLSRGNLEEAKEALQTALKKDPNCPFAHAFKMRLHRFMAEDAEADKEAEWLGRQPSLDIESRIFLSDHYAFLGDDRALPMIEDVLKDFPNDLEALAREIDVYQSESNYDLASRKIAKFQSLFPQHGYTFVLLAREAASKKDIVEAERLYRIALDKMPEMASAWAELSVRLTHSSQWDEAESCAKRALSICSRATLALRALSLVAQHRGDKEAANSYREQAAQATPFDASVNAMHEAGRLSKAGKIDEALKQADIAIQSPVKNTRVCALHLKIGILTRARNWIDLEQALNQLEAEGDRPALFYSGHVKVCLARKQMRDAWKWVVEGLSYWPASGELRADQIRLSHRYLTRKERYASLKEAVMVDYRMPSEAIHVINAMLACYQPETAMLLIRRACDLFPDRSDWDKLEKQANVNWNLRYGSVFDVSKSLNPAKKVLAIVTRSLLKLALTLQYGPPRRPR